MRSRQSEPGEHLSADPHAYKSAGPTSRTRSSKAAANRRASNWRPNRTSCVSLLPPGRWCSTSRRWLSTPKPMGSRVHFASPATTMRLPATPSTSSSASACRRDCSGVGLDGTPPGSDPFNGGPGAGLHLVEHPGATDLFERRLRHEVIEGRRDYVGIEALHVGAVLESVAIRQDEPEPEAQVWVRDGPDSASHGFADHRAHVFGEFQVLKGSQVRRQVTAAAAPRTRAVMSLTRVRPSLMARRIE